MTCKENKLPTLADQIRKKITRRILICATLLFCVFIINTGYDFYTNTKELKTTLTLTSRTLSSFIISQTLIDNSLAINFRLNKMSKNGIKYELVSSNAQELGKPKAFDKIILTSPWRWEYFYKIPSIGYQDIGLLKISGSLFLDPAIINTLILRTSILLLFCICMFIVLYPLAKKVPYELFLSPIQAILTSLELSDSCDLDEKKSISIELRTIQQKIFNLFEKIRMQSEKETLFSISAQVAHDIRSPLAAISILTESCAAIPEEERISLREAVGRIHDIANQLLAKHHSERSPVLNKLSSPVLVFEAIFFVLSGKRMEFRDKNVIFDLKPKMNVYFSFVYANATEFKRVISNIINNAVEAIDLSTGVVSISLEKNEIKNELIVAITDSGCGISEKKLNHLLNDSVIETSKEGGHGLGLVHAKETLRKLNAKFSIESKVNVGTTVTLEFPLMDTPSWITSEININETDCIVILDDDQSIHGAWDKLFSFYMEKYPDLELVHFTNGQQCIEFIDSFSQPEKILLLSDYELIDQDMNGLDVIEKTKLLRTVLVTSYYESSEVIERSSQLNVKILPKTLAAYVSIYVVPTVLQTSPIDFEKNPVDLVLIDNDKLVINTWKFSVKLKNKNILTFSNFEAAEQSLRNLDRATPIYIDSDLGTHISGEEYAKILYESGFTAIYLATGYGADSFKPMYWIKSIVGKEPQF